MPVACPGPGHGAGHTYALDEQVAWLATQGSKSAVIELMRIAWRTVGAIISRVWADTEVVHDRFDGLRRMGSRRSPIDEISSKRGHRYMTVVVDHDSGRLVWAAPGRDRATLEAFFDALGPERSTQITHVSADGADWISAVVADRCPDAVRCADPFHVVRWATDALDEVRRQARNQARGAVTQRRAGRASGHAKALKHARYALWKNPENLTTRQQAKLARIARTDPRLHRAYLLKEGLRLAFPLPFDEAPDALEAWIGWARRCRIPAFVELQGASSSAGPQSWPRSSTACPTDASRRSTPRPGSSPASPSDSAHPEPSSPWPCSASAATSPPSPAGHDPRISQESRKSGHPESEMLLHHNGNPPLSGHCSPINYRNRAFRKGLALGESRLPQG